MPAPLRVPAYYYFVPLYVIAVHVLRPVFVGELCGKVLQQLLCAALYAVVLVHANIRVAVYAVKYFLSRPAVAGNIGSAGAEVVYSNVVRVGKAYGMVAKISCQFQDLAITRRHPTRTRKKQEQFIFLCHIRVGIHKVVIVWRTTKRIGGVWGNNMFGLRKGRAQYAH